MSSITFKLKDILHKLLGKFTPAWLPNAKKPYNLRAVFQPEIDIHGIASKAAVYNIETDPQVIEEGFTAACELIYYLLADGYKVKTLLFNSWARLPGEYDGSETSLAPGLHAELIMQTAPPLREYIKEKVTVQIDGIDDTDGLIAEALDEHTGLKDDVMTVGNLVTLRGWGLKIDGEPAQEPVLGLWFDGPGAATRAEIIPVNEPKTLKFIVPATLTVGSDYGLVIVTQSSTKNNAAVLKHRRTLKSAFKLTVQN
jgi:hypothetical protein